MYIIVGIQARSKSTRLPGKIFKDIGSKSMLERVFEASHVEKWRKAMQTTVQILAPSDDQALVDFCEEKRLPVVVSDADIQDNDLLSRYMQAVVKLPECEGIIRVTSDTPLLPKWMVGRVLEALMDGFDYVTNVSPRTWPDGWDCQGITVPALKWYKKKQGSEEHMFYELENNSQLQREFMDEGFTMKSLINPERVMANPYHPENKMSVDTEDDLERVRKMYAAMAQQG